ncbi:radical SAM/SPASM domain-containing protein [Candidatus Thiodubiliella endoseptemdiera]|uniref:radical SAM/SPASM domain-containing protein n=1 Tax=Candidatus Thiodubiliella endoseptemdiera TaxID=2738886 RepID=UPI0034DFFAF1
MDNNRRLFHINVTRQCQLACSHCYIDQDIRDNGQSMSVDKMQEIAEVIGDTCADVHIIGGEPTLVSIDTHKQYLSILSKLKNSKIMIVTALQNARAVKVAKLYQNIATSYDPNARTEINNDQWLNRIKTLRKNGNNVHVCTSLSQSVIDYGVNKVLDEIYEFGFRSVHLAAMVPTINALEETPDPIATSEAMIESAEWVLKKRKTNQNNQNNNENIFVSPFDGLLQGMSNYDGLRCPAGEQCVNIEPNGQIHACVAKGGEVKDIIDNKQIKSTEEQLSSNDYIIEVAQHNRSRVECFGCEFWTTCKGGCRVLANTDIAKNSAECAGFKTFLKYVKDKETDNYD